MTFKTQEFADVFMNEAEIKFKEEVLTKQTKTEYYDSKKGIKKGKFVILYDFQWESNYKIFHH